MSFFDLFRKKSTNVSLSEQNSMTKGIPVHSTGKKKNAIVFVDFEHWYFGMNNYFHTKPDYKGFSEMISASYNIIDMYFFADFSLNGIKDEVGSIRDITNSIVETRNGSSYHKKDFTDFIILDYIYQRALSSPNIDCFIIFTGDGHFTSVANFLRSKCNKEVGICGIRGATSKHLCQAATWNMLFPDNSYTDDYYYGIILRNFDYLNKKKGKAYPTFNRTVEIVSQFYELDSAEVERCLSELIEQKYITYKTVRTDPGNVIKILQVNWDRCKDNGLWAN